MGKITWDINNSYGVTLSEDGLTAIFSGKSTNKIRATHGASNGKWYWEVSVINGEAISMGVVSSDFVLTDSTDVAFTPQIRTYYPYGGYTLPEVRTYGIKGGAIGSTYSVLIDLDNNTLEFWKNGVTMGKSHTDLNLLNRKVYAFIISGNAGSNNIQTNFGDAPFKYNVPVGYKKYSDISTNKTLILHDGEYKKYTVLEQSSFLQKSNNEFTGNSLDGDIVTASSSYSSDRDGWKAFDGIDNNDENSWTTPIKTPRGWLKYYFLSPQKINKYVIGSAMTTATAIRNPKNWTFEGSNDDINWKVLDTQSNIVFSSLGDKKEFVFRNNMKYKFYRLNVTLNNGDADHIQINELYLYEGVSSDWSAVSNTLPTSTQFLSDGMDNLSPLLDRVVTELEPMTMTDKSEILQDGEVGKVFNISIDLKKCLDIRNIRTEVE